ncbi:MULTISPECIES: acyltransferase family protein [Aeromicrobium]|uniref:Acyltransferase family protein n=1 Tax=Aeromicrobium yanjiei TaxID=2662028 RepID=A0A5Q2MIT6_9ACTN|nr:MULTISPECIES: acyltransferase family protein [Aeromicrobium]MRK00569.1 acyltransferase family protein [Aeromicrobium sp. S22]QGG42598.1 acyltransferase family protein [Aeromicrobium yanjiei]
MSALDPLPVATAPPKERVAYLDNARYWVMLLVVIGHSLTEYVVMDSAKALYTWIYLFHMPFFILISGYTARHYIGDFRQIRRIVSTLIVPYLLVETSLQLITRHYDNEPKTLMILSPQWLGWFLAALFLWRITTPIWRALKYPITTSIVISLLAGLIEIPNVLALPKVLALLPFWVIGLHMNRELFLRLGDWRIRIVSAITLALAFVFCELYSADWTTQWLLWKDRYDEPPLDATAWEGMMTRGELLLVGAVLTFATLSLIPRSRSFTTVLGGRTFYCYLLHGYIIILLDRELDLWSTFEEYGATAVAVFALAAIVVANLLMTKPVATVFRPLFEPKLTWLFREAEPPSVRVPADTVAPDQAPVRAP